MITTENKKSKATDRDKSFPKLMRSENLIILFTEDRKGTALQGTSTYPIGYFSDTWYMDDFELLGFNESVTLIQG